MAASIKDVIPIRRGLEITRDARFAANKRFNDRHRGSAYVVSVLSTGVILLSLLPNFVNLSPGGSQILLACSVVLSVFIIFTSLLDHTSNFYHKGETLHLSARKLNALLQKTYLVQEEDDVLSKMKEINEEYQKVLDECPFNHEQVDYLNVRVDKPALFVGKSYSANKPMYFLQRATDRLKLFFYSYFWVFPHIIVTGLVLYVALSVVAGSEFSITSASSPITASASYKPT